MTDLYAVFLMGPSGCGKTQLSLELAEQLPCEIISVDSALVYKNMDVGTAKPTREERRRVPHHLIDIIEPTERYSAGQFIQAAAPLIERINRDGKIPLLVGGTMFYFHALEKGLDDMPDVSDAVREEIEQLERQHGSEFLYRELKRVDKAAAEHIHPNDTQRIKRGLEVYRESGVLLSDLQRGRIEGDSCIDSRISFVKFGLLPENRTDLHRIVEKRFDKMLVGGLVDEVAALMLRGDLDASMPAVRMVGYAQVWAYLLGKYSYEEMRYRAICATRQLIKRQLTWMKSMQGVKKHYIMRSQLGSQVGKQIIANIRVAGGKKVWQR